MDIYGTLPNSAKIHIYFKCTWIVNQDRSYAGLYVSIFKSLKSYREDWPKQNYIRNWHRKMLAKSRNIWILSSSFLYNSWIKEKMTREIRKYSNRMKMKTVCQYLRNAAKECFEGNLWLQILTLAKEKTLKSVTSTNEIQRSH